MALGCPGIDPDYVGDKIRGAARFKLLGFSRSLYELSQARISLGVIEKYSVLHFG